MLQVPQPITGYAIDGPPADAYAERMRVEQVAALYGYILIGVLGALFGGIILNIALYCIGTVSFLTATSWIAYASTCTLLHLVLRHFYWRSPRRDRDWRLWARWFTAASLLDGLGWGWGDRFPGRAQS